MADVVEDKALLPEEDEREGFIARSNRLAELVPGARSESSSGSTTAGEASLAADAIMALAALVVAAASTCCDVSP